VGNCCAQNSNPATIELGTSDNDGTCRDPNTHTHLRDWDVSSVPNMMKSELCVSSVSISPPPLCVFCPLVQGVCSCDLTLCLFCVFLPPILMYSVLPSICF
jgi:hypothetical protein